MFTHRFSYFAHIFGMALGFTENLSTFFHVVSDRRRCEFAGR